MKWHNILMHPSNLYEVLIRRKLLKANKFGQRPQKNNPPLELLEEETTAADSHFSANTAITGGGTNDKSRNNSRP